MKSWEIFKKIDQFIFTKCDEWRATDKYHQLNQQLIQLNVPQRQLIVSGLFLTICSIPVLTFIFFYFFNLGIYHSLQNKNEILTKMDQIFSLEKGMNQFEETLITTQPISSENELKAMIEKLPNNASLKNRISFSSLEQTPIGNSYFLNEITIQVHKISTTELANMHKIFYQNLKARFYKTSLQRTEEKLLTGSFSMRFYSAQ